MGIIDASYGAQIPDISPCGPGGAFVGMVGYSSSGASDYNGAEISTSEASIVWGSAASTGNLTFGTTPLPGIDTPYWQTAVLAKSMVSEACKTVWYETTRISGSESETLLSSSLETSGTFHGYALSFHSAAEATGSRASEINITGKLKIVPDGFTGYVSDLDTTSSANLGTITVTTTFASYSFWATSTAVIGEDVSETYYGVAQSSEVVTGTTAVLAVNGGGQIDIPVIYPQAIWVIDTAYGASDHSVVRLGASYGSAVDNGIAEISLIHPAIGDVVSYPDWTYRDATEYRFTDTNAIEFLTLNPASKLTLQNVNINLVSSENSTHGRTYASLGYFQSGEPIVPLGTYIQGMITAIPDQGFNIPEETAVQTAPWHLRATTYAPDSTETTTIEISASSVFSAPDGGWIYLQPDYFITARQSGILF